MLAEFATTATDDPRRRLLRDDLMTGLWPVVVHIARRYRRRGEPVADLQQIGAVGLLGALERFDPDRGIDFLAFAVPTITGEIRQLFRDRSWSMRVPERPAQHAHIPHVLDEGIGGAGAEPALGDLLGAADTALIAAGYRHDLRRALAALPERERTILVLRFFGDLTQTQIAEQVGVSQMHVSRLLSRTLATLRARIDDLDHGVGP